MSAPSGERMGRRSGEPQGAGSGERADGGSGVGGRRELYIPDPADRDDLGAFTARVVRLDQGAPVRLRAVGELITAWAPTPFEVLVSRAVQGELRPSEVTVAATDLLSALAVVRDERVEPGGVAEPPWLAELPPTEDWLLVEQVPAKELEELAENGLALAKEHAGPHGNPPSGLLDQTVLTASRGEVRVRVPLRCLFALYGMGFLGGGTDTDQVRIAATDSWMRLDASYGTVLRRRQFLLPLVF
jgi:hypothetical protein